VGRDLDVKALSNMPRYNPRAPTKSGTQRGLLIEDCEDAKFQSTRPRGARLRQAGRFSGNRGKTSLVNDYNRNAIIVVVVCCLTAQGIRRIILCNQVITILTSSYRITASFF
jgi:hypothetical protein